MGCLGKASLWPSHFTKYGRAATEKPRKCLHEKCSKERNNKFKEPQEGAGLERRRKEAQAVVGPGAGRACVVGHSGDGAAGGFGAEWLTQQRNVGCCAEASEEAAAKIQATVASLDQGGG